MNILQNSTIFTNNVTAGWVNETRNSSRGQQASETNKSSEQSLNYRDLNPRHVANEVEKIVKTLSGDCPDWVPSAGPGNKLSVPKHLIFPGRSTAPLIAAIEVMEDQIEFQSLVNFSISCFRRGPSDPLFDSYLEELHQYFEDSIPTKPFLDGNPITVVDCAQSGETLLAVTYNLKTWLRSKGLRNKVVGFALRSPKNLDDVKIKFKVNRISLQTAKFQHQDVEAAFQNAVFDSASSQIHYDIMNPPTNPTEKLCLQQERYQDFKNGWIRNTVNPTLYQL